MPNTDDLQLQIDALRLELESLKKIQVVDYVPKGVNFALTSPQSVDPGHQHVYPPSNRINVFTQFESIDSWETGGLGTEDVQSTIGLLFVGTGNNGGDTAYATPDPAFNLILPSTKRSGYQTVVRFSHATSQVAYIGVGMLLDVLGVGVNLTEGYGFKVVDGTLYALTTKNGSETLSQISGVSLGNFNEYKVMFDITEASFYVNGKFVAKHTTNLFDTDCNNFFFYHIRNTSAASRNIRARYAFFTQEL